MRKQCYEEYGKRNVVVCVCGLGAENDDNDDNNTVTAAQEQGHLRYREAL